MQLQLDFRSAVVTMVQDHLKEQSETDSQSESTSGKSERDPVASLCNQSRRRRSLDGADVRHLGGIKGFVYASLLQCAGVILVVLLLQLLRALQSGDFWAGVGQLFHPFLNIDNVVLKCVHFCFHAGEAGALTS